MAPRGAPFLAVSILLLLTAGGIASCGGGTPVAAVRKQAKSKVSAKSAVPPPKANPVVARIDASSDAIVAEGKVHIASGAPSDAEVRRELEAARRAGIVLPTGESAASFEDVPSNGGGPVAEAEVPHTPWNPRSKPIADWIIPVLAWASEHGWSGTVTSGYRTFYEQAQLNAAGAYSAKAGLSNHETTKYPGGAVDVTMPSQLISALRTYPGPMKLVGGVLGPVDPEHFSATGD
jgi:hypothetical protein